MKGARKDIQTLTVKLFALKGFLEYVKEQQREMRLAGHHTTVAKIDPQDVLQMMELARETVDSISTTLTGPRSALSRSLQSAKWPWKSSEVLTNIKRIERIKTWLMLVLTNESL